MIRISPVLFRNKRNVSLIQSSNKHAMERIRERYNLDIDDDFYFKLNEIANGENSLHIKFLGENKSLRIFKFSGMYLLCVFDIKLDEVITLLPRNSSQFPKAVKM